MAAANFLPNLSLSDVDRAAQLIQQAYVPPSLSVSSEEQRRLQQELFDIQKRPEAWGLVLPFLEHQDPNVQFFGAHTAQVKIARDWESFPDEHAQSLRDLIIQLTAHSVVAGCNKVILRKLFVALASLALKLVPGRPTRWPDWIMACVTSLSGRGAPTEHILDFLSIVAEEVESADLLGSSKTQMRQTLTDAIPMVVQAITTSITRPRQGGSSLRELQSALKCLEGWISILPSSDLIPAISLLIALLAPSEDDDTFIAASDALQEIMAKSALSDGSGSKTLTEPLLLWLDIWGRQIIEESIRSGNIDEKSHSLCKLLAAIGDHSTSYIASNLASTTLISLAPSSSGATLPTALPTRGHLTQTFLRLLLVYTALPGYYGVDEEESEITLGFWYLFQEALWSTDFYFQEGEDGVASPEKENDLVTVSKAVYRELVQVLRRKVVFPGSTNEWTRDQVDKFQVYRRDIGDTLINAYYVLRDEMLGYYVSDIVTRLATKQEHEGWEEIEATLHCIASIQEALDLENAAHLSRLFGPEILGRLPTAGHNRVRRTALGVIGAYSSWFATQPSDQPSSTPSILMNVVAYVVSALSDPSLCLQAANALRDLCDANRTALAPSIGAFAELHAGLTGILDTEKSKVLQSIASVIQALPPDEEIPPIEAIVSPVVQKLLEALRSSAHLPEEARAMAVMQIETLSGVAKGLTRTTDALLTFDESPDVQAEAERMRRAREDPRVVKLREAVFSAIRSAMDMWSTDAAIGGALSELFKSITCLPSDTTLLSLPAGPLLELVCLASQRHLTAIWLSLAGMLIAQLNPPSLLLSLKSKPTPEAQATVSRILPVLLQTSLNSLGQSGALEANPDVVQDFFGCMDTVAQNFSGAFFTLPSGALDALLQCAITSLALQERYSLVSACMFLGTLINRTFIHEELADAKALLIQMHGRPILRAVLCGFAGVAPRSATPNLIELLSTLVSRCPAECRVWVGDILFASDFTESKAGPEAKEKFVKAVLSSRSLKRTREAAQQFTLIARGLEGSSFGYASVSM